MQSAMATAGKKRKKNFYCKKSKRSHNRELSLGMSGILITSNGSEKMCVREAYNLLNEMADSLYGCEEKVVPLDSDSSESDDGYDDIDKKIKQEVTNLKEDKERRFQSLFSGAKNLVFIKCRSDIDPCQLVLHVLTIARDTKVQKARFFPVSVVCSASLSEIKKHSLPMISEYFHGLDPKPVEFAVHCKCRNNNVLKRMDVIDLVASLVTNDHAYPHVVNLVKPELVVIVMIIKNLCCMSIVKDFNTLNEYNIQSFYTPSVSAPQLEEGTALPMLRGNDLKSSPSHTQETAENEDTTSKGDDDLKSSPSHTQETAENEDTTSKGDDDLKSSPSHTQETAENEDTTSKGDDDLKLSPLNAQETAEK